MRKTLYGSEYHPLCRVGRTYDFETMHAVIAASGRVHEPCVTVGLDSIDMLDATVVRELVRGLRKIRETGGILRLHVTRPDLASALRGIGLESIFQITADCPRAASPRAADELPLD